MLYGEHQQEDSISDLDNTDSDADAMMMQVAKKILTTMLHLKWKIAKERFNGQWHTTDIFNPKSLESIADDNSDL